MSGYGLDLMLGTATGAAAPGAALTMKNGSTTLTKKGNKQPYVVGLLISCEARVRESYVNWRLSTDGSKTSVYRRVYQCVDTDSAVMGPDGLGFFPIMKQAKMGDVLDIGVVDVATTNVFQVGILIHYGGPPRIIPASKLKDIWHLNLTPDTPADAGTVWANTGARQTASGELAEFPPRMDIIGGYLIPESAAGGGALRISQAFDDSVQPGLCSGSGFLTLPNGDVISLGEINNVDAIQGQATVIAADEIEGGLYLVA